MWRLKPALTVSEVFCASQPAGRSDVPLSSSLLEFVFLSSLAACRHVRCLVCCVLTAAYKETEKLDLQQQRRLFSSHQIKRQKDQCEHLLLVSVLYRFNENELHTFTQVLQ